MYDGGHCDLRGNLVKAMMVLNWLNVRRAPPMPMVTPLTVRQMIDVSEH